MAAEIYIHSMRAEFIRSIKEGKLATEDIVRYCKENFVSEDEIIDLMIDLHIAAVNAPEKEISLRLHKAFDTIDNRWGIDLFRLSEFNSSVIIADMKKRLGIAEADRQEQGETSQKPQNKQRERKATPFTYDEAQKEATLKAFAMAIEKGLMEHDGNDYKWISTNSLYGYFVDQLSKKCDLKSSSGRISWKYFESFVTNHNVLLVTAKQAVNDYKNKNLNPPEGDDIVNEIIKAL